MPEKITILGLISFIFPYNNLFFRHLLQTDRESTIIIIRSIAMCCFISAPP